MTQLRRDSKSAKFRAGSCEPTFAELVARANVLVDNLRTGILDINNAIECTDYDELKNLIEIWSAPDDLTVGED